MFLSIAILQYSSLQGVIDFVVFLKSAFSVFHGGVRQGLNFKGILIYWSLLVHVLIMQIL